MKGQRDVPPVHSNNSLFFMGHCGRRSLASWPPPKTPSIIPPSPSSPTQSLWSGDSPPPPSLPPPSPPPSITLSLCFGRGRGKSQGCSSREQCCHGVRVKKKKENWPGRIKQGLLCASTGRVEHRWMLCTRCQVSFNVEVAVS